jgi:hypothetical protein
MIVLYPKELSIHPLFIQPAQSQTNHYRNFRTINKTNGDRTTNVGSMRIMGEGMERPGIGSNQIWAMHSLHDSIQSGIQTNEAEGSLGHVPSDAYISKLTAS